jgi:hypothetical protein
MFDRNAILCLRVVVPWRYVELNLATAENKNLLEREGREVSDV